MRIRGSYHRRTNERPTERLDEPKPEPEPSLYPGQAPVVAFIYFSVLSAGMYISHLIDGSGRSWCTVYTGVLLWQRTEASRAGALPPLWALRPRAEQTGSGTCLSSSPGGYVRTNEDPHGRQRKAADRRDDSYDYGAYEFPWRQKRPWTSCVGRRMMSMSAGAARHWRLEVGVLRGVISSRDHERRTFHGPSLTSSNNRPNHSSLFFFGLHRRCALPSYRRIVPPRLPYFLKSSSVHLFSLSTTKFMTTLCTFIIY